ncbi:MAG: peptidoglycan-binding protein, partial [Pseudomonadota bacterium]
MALNRRSGARFEANAWPGFVDAMTALLLILMFVLSIFMIVQFSLRETVTGQSRQIEEQSSTISAQSETIDEQETQIDRLSAQLSQLSRDLGLEQESRAEAETALGELRATLREREAERTRIEDAFAALSQRYEQATGEVDRLGTALAAA